MNIESIAVVEPRRMGMYDASHQIGVWADCFKAESSQNTSSSAIVEERDGRIENLVGSPSFFFFLASSNLGIIVFFFSLFSIS